MYIKEIISLIEDYAPLKLQASFDNSGLLCGDPERELTSILLCIDVTEEVVKEAIDFQRAKTYHSGNLRGALRDRCHQTRHHYLRRTHEHGRGSQRCKRTYGR